MPKDEFDFDDPMELNGIGIVSGEDTTEAMTECFVEEFMRLGYNHKQILAMFRNPHYIGMNMALQNRGETFVRERIEEVFARGGRGVRWEGGGAGLAGKAEGGAGGAVNSGDFESAGARPAEAETPNLGAEPAKAGTPNLDPMGAPIPDIIV
jgi:hypothetical protein